MFVLSLLMFVCLFIYYCCFGGGFVRVIGFCVSVDVCFDGFITVLVRLILGFKKKNYHHPHHNIIISIISIIRGKCVLSWCDGSSDRSFMVDPLSYFSFQPVLHDWFNKGCGMCYPVCGMMRIKESLLLIGKSSPCGGSGLPVSLSEWSFTI